MTWLSTLLTIHLCSQKIRVVLIAVIACVGTRSTVRLENEKFQILHWESNSQTPASSRMPERTVPPRVSLLGKCIQLKLNPDSEVCHPRCVYELISGCVVNNTTVYV